MEIDNSERDLRFMREAIKEAYKAAAKLEVPVGAVVVEGDQVIARGHWPRERLGDPTAHARCWLCRRRRLGWAVGA